MIDFVFRDGDIHWETMRQLCAAVPFQLYIFYKSACRRQLCILPGLIYVVFACQL